MSLRPKKKTRYATKDVAMGSLEGGGRRGAGVGMGVKRKQVLGRTLGDPGFSFAVPDPFLHWLSLRSWGCMPLTKSLPLPSLPW